MPDERNSDPPKKSDDTSSLGSSKSVSSQPSSKTKSNTPPGKTNLDEELNPDVVRNDGYEVLKQIGEGGFSKVYLARHIDPKTKVETILAAKIIRWDMVPQVWRDQRSKEELKIVAKVSHKHIVKTAKVYKTARRAYIFMEYAPISLSKKLEDHAVKFRDGFSEKTTNRYFKQLIGAIAFLHHKGVAHRDLKTDNILLDKNDDVKLTDFSFACYTFNRQTSERVLTSTACGTLDYQPPEMFLKPCEYDAQIADVWSVGVILYELMFVRYPFILQDEMTKNQKLQVIQSTTITMKDKKSGAVSNDFKSLQQELLKIDPKKRITAEKAEKHPWTVKFE